MSSESACNNPKEVEETANAAINNLLPIRSKYIYEKAYNLFRGWCSKKKVNNITENVILAYMEEKSKKVKGSTLWSTYAMLKSTLNVKDNIDIRKFPKLVPYLKNKTVGYRDKKSKMLSSDDILKFMEADDTSYLFMKVVLIVGISGACRCYELVKMTIDDIQDMNSVLIVKVPDTKTNTERTSTISNVKYIDLYRKYVALRPKHATTRRLFLKYYKGKCANQPVGLNKMGSIPSLIAVYLGKDSPKSFTGHCFRRSSATLLSNADEDITTLKCHGDWKSTSVAEGYIEDCLTNKIAISNNILNSHPSTSTSTSHIKECITGTPKVNTSNTVSTSLSFSGINFINCSNCTINFNIHK